MIYPEDVAKLGRGSKWHRSQPSSLHLKSSRVPLGVTVTPVVGPAALAQGRDNPILTDLLHGFLNMHVGEDRWERLPNRPFIPPPLPSPKGSPQQRRARK